MPWLSYSQDEVAVFHPEFDRVANNALSALGLAGQYKWEHHPQSNGVQVIPDFVLVDANGRWLLVVEIKRSKAAVFSQRNQVQAKGYAEANQLLYALNRPKFFCVTNFESTLLFALNGSHPPKDCRVQNMEFDSGSFAPGTTIQHQAAFQRDLQLMIGYVRTATQVTYESIWPRIAQAMIRHADQSPYDPAMVLNTGVPRVVADYFGGTEQEVAKKEVFFRCLVAEYLKGILQRYGHAGAQTVPMLRCDINALANQILALRTIDFAGIFEPTAPNLYLTLGTIAACKDAVEDYLNELLEERVNNHALTRNDVQEFPDILIDELYPLQLQNRRGKAQTDPDLAFLLAALTIESADEVIIDPCAGDGNLLSAAYNLLTQFGASHAQSLGNLRGIEADPVSAKVAALRLASKAPSALAHTDPNHIECGDMFSSAGRFVGINAVLMNPPFKRYEAQDDSPIPDELRAHYKNCIRSLGGNVETESGQSNIYNLYVEYAVKAAPAETTFGFILDNRWYHKENSGRLRSFLVRYCQIIAVVEYPHDAYFEDWMIATSLLIARKRLAVEDHVVKFIRGSDPRLADFMQVTAAVRSGLPFPPGWTMNEVSQTILGADSWKRHFTRRLSNEFRDPNWPGLSELFNWGRRGSLEKEGGGVAVLECPFNRTEYGPRRAAKANPRNRFDLADAGALTPTQNAQLRAAASVIPPDFRGYALKNSNALNSYTLTQADVTVDQVIETPHQRTPTVQPTYFSDTRRAWDADLDTALAQIIADPAVNGYVTQVDAAVNLSPIFRTSDLWIVLREPFAGELIIPRKLRAGHRLHINPFAYNSNGRQVRISSNFLTFGECVAIDPSTGLDRQKAVELIMAYLLSSFGQLQFELEGNNREGLRSIEMIHVNRIRILDPRQIRPSNRQAILTAAATLPCPLPTNIHPHLQPQLMALDELIADEICALRSNLSRVALLQEVHQQLFDCLEARRP